MSNLIKCPTDECHCAHRTLSNKQSFSLPIELYLHQKERHWPKLGKRILAHYDDNYVVVYQAYNDKIAKYAATHQRFQGCPDFSASRMTWVKTNFLWMMYRCGWGHKDKNQTSTLAIWLHRWAFEEILSRAVKSVVTGDPTEWKQKLQKTSVVLQWDPDHSPTGGKVERRAIQLGLRGIKEFVNGHWIAHIEDISSFVAEQYENLKTGTPECFEDLQTPIERVYSLSDQMIEHITAFPNVESTCSTVDSEPITKGTDLEEDNLSPLDKFN